MKTITKILLAGVIFFFFVIFFFRSCQSSIESRREEKKAKTSALSPNPSEYSYQTIEYNSEYGNEIYLSTMTRFSFINATEPYCCINKGGHEECGNAGQDISTEMGSSGNNTVLKFKSSNGKSGKLTLRTRDK